MKALLGLRDKILKKGFEKARGGDLMAFTCATSKGYDPQWFHKSICKELESLYRGDIKKLMIFMPPQTGKSELSSRRFPAWVLGQNPEERIAICCYGSEVAKGFNRDIQRVIESKNYNKIFPETKISTQVVGARAKQTTGLFEVVGNSGSVRTVGFGGPLTSFTVDLGIIDDPFKDREQANSKTQRDKVWNWYNDVFKTRLHNSSRQLVLLTRWHDDDLAGRILRDEPGEWEVVTFRGLKEDGDNHPDDKREIGEALWEEKHSKDRYIKIKDKTPITYASLIQQRPNIQGGNMVKKNWFGTYKIMDLLSKSYTVNIYIDTALEEKEISNNDPSGILVFTEIQNYIYLIHFQKGKWGFPDLISQIISVNETFATARTVNIIENKANGKSVKQQLTKDTKLNILLDNVKGKKGERLSVQTERIMTGRVLLPEGMGWVEPFLDVVARFPSVIHDEEVDVLTGAMRYVYDKNKVKLSDVEYGVASTKKFGKPDEMMDIKRPNKIKTSPMKGYS